MLWNKTFIYFQVPYPLNPNHQLNIVILEHFAYYEIFWEMFFFPSQISLKAFFLKNRNTALVLLKTQPFILIFFREDKRIFVSFVKLLNISLDDKSLICNIFIEAEMILFCKYAEFRIIWLFSNEFLHSSLLQFFCYKSFLVQDATLMFFSQINK